MTITRDRKQSVPSLMHETSLPSVSIYWLDIKEAQARIYQAAQRLAEKYPEIEEIWLFGSLARGDAVPGSDADLLIVLSDSDLAFWDRSVRYQPEFCGIGVDVLAYTRAELSRLRDECGGLWHEVEREGICLFQRVSQGG